MDNHWYGSNLMKQISLFSANMGKSYGLCGENKFQSRLAASWGLKRLPNVFSGQFVTQNSSNLNILRVNDSYWS